MPTEGKTAMAAGAWVLNGDNVRVRGMTTRTCACAWEEATWHAACAARVHSARARGRLSAHGLCGHNALGDGQAEGPRLRRSPQ
jgi:hypothetical protein